MRVITILTFFVLFSCSCKSIKMGTEVTDHHPKPYVKTKNGKMVDAKIVKAKNNNIEADGEKYKRKEVAGYSDGKNIYINTKKKVFAQKVFEGDFTVYRFSTHYTSTSYVGVTPSSPTGWHSSNHGHTSYFIQPKGADDVVLLSYRNMKKIIPKTEPAYEYLRLYKKNNIIASSALYTGIALFFTGTAIWGNNIGTPDGHSNKAGVTAGSVVVLAGMTSFITSFVIRPLSMRHLQQSVAKHNNVLVE